MRRDRRGLRAWPGRRRRLPLEPRRERGVVPRRLVPHRRLRVARPGGLRAPGGPHQGADQPRRREDLAARGRGRAAQAPGRDRGRRVLAARRQVRRDGRRRGRADRRRRRGGPAAPLRRPARELQGADADRADGRDPEGRHRQDPATHAWPSGSAPDEDRDRRRRRDRRLRRRGPASRRRRRVPGGAWREPRRDPRARRAGAVRARRLHGPRARDRRPGRDRPGRHRLPRPEGLPVRIGRRLLAPLLHDVDRASSRRRTGCRGGTSTGSTGRTRGAASRRSTRAARRPR